MSPNAPWEVRERILACQDCQLSSQPTIRPVPWSGPDHPEIVVVGEAPGAHENARGVPFIGPAGQRARKWLSDIGEDPESVGFVNIVSCYPARMPELAEITACGANFRSQMELLAPKVVLVFGGVAFGQFWANLALRTARGLWWQENMTWGPVFAMATWHPSYALREPDADTAARADMRLFRLGLTGIRRGEMPLGRVRCGLCGREEGQSMRRYRQMPFCEGCEPAEEVLARHFPEAVGFGPFDT